MPPKPELDIKPDIMAEVNLPCTVAGCGFKTGELAQAVAASVLSSHTTGNHSGTATPSGRRNDRIQRLDQPILTRGCSQQDLGFFKDEWRRYSDSADTTNDNLLRDQLLQCDKISLRKTLQNTLGMTKMATISVADLMLEKEKQSDLLNEVKLMEAKQELDEPVRTFVARLRGLANICILTKTISHVEPTVVLALVKGLADGDTKGEILSNVKHMDLDETVAFVE